MLKEKMRRENQPLVSIVTPAYNSEKYLAECIESVLNQTYCNWEYIIVNNCSSDHTNNIAKSYLSKDKRIRIHNNANFLEIIQNWNHALRQISPRSKYCKIIHADDFLFPECIEKMVLFAEDNPKTGIVGSYRLDGNGQRGEVKRSGLPYSTTVLSGHEVCRSRLKGEPSLFGSPTGFLIRSAFIRRNDPFYDESFFHADIESYFKILQNSDFGFIHQLLTFTRLHEESQTVNFTDKYDSSIIEYLRILKKYGVIYFSPDEYTDLFNHRIKQYHRLLIRRRLKGKGNKYFNYHKNELKKLDHSLKKRHMLSALVLELINLILLNPQNTFKNLNKLEWFKK